MEQETKVKIVNGVREGSKLATSVVGGACCGHVVSEIVNNLMPPQAKMPMKIATIVGTSLISSAIADIASEKTCDSIDAVADYVVGFMVGVDDICAATTDTDADEYEDIINKMLEEEGNAGDIRPEEHAEHEACCID